MSHARCSHILGRSSRPPLQIYPQQKLVFSCQNWLTTPPSLAPQSTHRSHLQLRQRRTWLRVWRWGVEGSMRWGGEGQWRRKYLVSSLLLCLIGRYWKMSFVLGPRPARGTEDPPHWCTITSGDLQVWVALLNPVVGRSLSLQAPTSVAITDGDFSCDNILSRRILKGHVFLRKSGWLLLKSY